MFHLLEASSHFSAREFGTEFYGTVQICFIKFFFFRNSINSALVKLLLLSMTSTSGRSWVEKISCSFDIIDHDVLVYTRMASIHFEWASTTTSNIIPMNKSVKSSYILDHGFWGQGQVLAGSSHLTRLAQYCCFLQLLIGAWLPNIASGYFFYPSNTRMAFMAFWL